MNTIICRRFQWRLYLLLKSLYVAIRFLFRAFRNPTSLSGKLSKVTNLIYSGEWNKLILLITEQGGIGWEWYDVWFDRYEVKRKDYLWFEEVAASWRLHPLISINMPIYNTNIAHLKEAIESIRRQVYTNWELCIAVCTSLDALDVKKVIRTYASLDARIKFVHRDINGSICAAGNTALTMAEGEFVALVGHDDTLHPLALWFVSEAIVRCPSVGLIYTDNDRLSLNGRHCDPCFKCDFNHELMLARNLVGQLVCYRRSLVAEIGGFREGFEGAEDYDLALRSIERLSRDQIVHIPSVLYHWRESIESTASSMENKRCAAMAALRCVSEYLKRNGFEGEVMAHALLTGTNRVRPALPAQAPMVTIIIPTRDRSDLLRVCIHSIRSRTTYPNYEIIIIDNGSIEKETLTLLEKLRLDGIRVLRDEGDFNYSRLNNLAVKAAHGSLCCLMNNDIEVISPEWLEEMVGFAVQSDIGAVGARLWFPDNRLQHGGVILLGLNGIAGHAFTGLTRKEPGYMGRAVLHQEVSAVTGACLLVRKSVFEQVNGLEEALAVEYNDIDFCLRLRQAGYRNVWTPFAEMYHHESASRGANCTPEKRLRSQQEGDFMRRRWGNILANDPYYSPNLSRIKSYSLSWQHEALLYVAPQASYAESVPLRGPVAVSAARRR